MESALIIYNLLNLDHYHKLILDRILFGYTNNSNNNQYHYKKEGVLSTIPSFRLPKGAVIVKKQDQNKITSILKKHKAKYRVFKVSVDKGMLS